MNYAHHVLAYTCGAVPVLLNHSGNCYKLAVQHLKVSCYGFLVTLSCSHLIEDFDGLPAFRTWDACTLQVQRKPVVLPSSYSSNTSEKLGLQCTLNPDWVVATQTLA